MVNLVAAVLIFDYLVWICKHHRGLSTLFGFDESVCRPSFPEAFPIPPALVFSTSCSLQSHVGRHVPDLDRRMVNTADPRADGNRNDILRS